MRAEALGSGLYLSDTDAGWLGMGSSGIPLDIREGSSTPIPGDGDPGRGGTLSIALSDGFGYVSDSGALLTPAPVPLPGAGLLLGAALLALGRMRRRG